MYFIIDSFKSLYESPDIWMEWIQKGTIFFYLLSTPVRAIFEGTNIEITNTMMSRMHFYNKLEEEELGEEFTKGNFTGAKKKSQQEKR